MSITVLSRNGPHGLSARPPLPPEILERGTPSIHGHTYFSGAGVSCVVWGATPYRIRPKQRPDYEFSVLLEGRFRLTDGAGADTHVDAGDAFVLPPGFTYQWGQDVPTLKFALSFTPPEPPGPGSVFTVFRAAELRRAVRSDAERSLFADRSGRFRVGVMDLPAGDAGRLGAGHTLITVVAGAVTLAEEGGRPQHLGSGETALVAAERACAIVAEQPARLLHATVSPA